MSKFNIDDYEPVVSFAIPCYRYDEGKEHEEFYVDFQNAVYYLYGEIDDHFLVGGKKVWLICPMKPKGVTLTKENAEELTKWVVDEATDKEDLDLEWDFEEHKPIRS